MLVKYTKEWRSTLYKQTLTSVCTHLAIITAAVTTSREGTSVHVRMAGRDKTVMSVRASSFCYMYVT